MQIIIVGGGMAGLACARLLAQAGHSITLFEASDDIGGRVRSDYAEGYTFDRGFQVLFDAYPAARRLLDLRALDLRCFTPGAIICREGRRDSVSDPLRDRSPTAALSAALTPLLTPLDKLHMLRLALRLRAQSIDAVLAGSDTTTADYLTRQGFSGAAIDNFFRPFFGGIFLDRTLQTSAKNFRYNFKMLSEGSACVPAQGMGTIAQQLAAPLRNQIQTRVCVAALLSAGGHVVGVRLDDGSERRADAVVVATPAPEAARLTDLPMPTDAVQTTTLYFGGTRQLYQGGKLLLHAAPDAFVNNAQLVSNVAPSYAPPGHHLLSVTVLGVPPLADEELAARALADLRLMFSGDDTAQQALDTYRLLRVYRLPYAQFAQPPGIHPTLPDNASGRPGLFFAAEFTEASSINAAMISGEKCAALIGQAGAVPAAG
jgi:phytoene dehydrogenase-like protein